MGLIPGLDSPGQQVVLLRYWKLRFQFREPCAAVGQTCSWEGWEALRKAGGNIHVHQLVEQNLLVDLLARVVSSCVLLSNRML